MQSYMQYTRGFCKSRNLKFYRIEKNPIERALIKFEFKFVINSLDPISGMLALRHCIKIIIFD